MLLAPFIDPLERLDLPYCVTGSVAASVYGEPRLTADIDIVLLIQLADIGKLRSAFPESDYYVPPVETLAIETARGQRGTFNLIHHASQYKADIFVAAQDPLHRFALNKRRRVALEGMQLWIAPPEYVIVRKLEYLREGNQDKHVRDIRFVLRETDVDRLWIEVEVERLGLHAQWNACRN